MKKIGEKKFIIPAVIIMIIAAAVSVSIPAAKMSAEKAEIQKTETVQTTKESGTNVEKYGFTFELLGKEIKFPLELKKDFLDKGFTFMSYDEIKKVYKNKTVDARVILENADRNIMFGDTFFTAKVSAADKPVNSFEGTAVTGISAGKLRNDTFSVNGYGYGHKMSSLIKAFGDGYTVLAEENSDADEGEYSIEYNHDGVSVIITSDDGEIVAMNAEYTGTK